MQRTTNTATASANTLHCENLVRCDTVSGSGAAKRSPSEQRCSDATMIDASELLNMTGVPLHLALECTRQRETGAIP
jgi:hypothetical protein